MKAMCWHLHAAGRVGIDATDISREGCAVMLLALLAAAVAGLQRQVEQENSTHQVEL